MGLFLREEYIVGPRTRLTVGQLYTVMLQTELTVGQLYAVVLRTGLTVGQPGAVELLELLLSADIDSEQGDEGGKRGREDDMWSGGCP